MAAGLASNPKTWAWGAGVLGIILVICGFLGQGDDKHKNCKSNNYTWVTIVVGFIMVLAGFMALMKMGKKAGGMAGGEASISPEPSPEGPM